MLVSAAERGYVLDGLRADYRADGRARLDWRELAVETRLAPLANGSARCRLGGTEVLAACRLEVEEVAAGSLEVFVESTPAALAALDGDVAGTLVGHLHALFARSLAGHRQLSILPGRRSWSVYLDVTLVACDGGNVLDVATCAAHRALGDLVIPKTRPIGLSAPAATDLEDRATRRAEGIEATLRGGVASTTKATQRPIDFELVSYFDEGDALEGAADLPVSVTLSLLDDLHFVDATLQEAACASSRLVVGCDRQRRVRLVRQEGDLELEAAALDGLLERATELAAELLEALATVRTGHASD